MTVPLALVVLFREQLFNHCDRLDYFYIVLESIGPVRNIQVLAHLDGHTVRLDNASGEIGGQRVNIDGSTVVAPTP